MMNRRSALQACVAWLASFVLVPGAGYARLLVALRVWVIDDGGETWWYVARSEQAALAEHIRMNYTESGESLDMGQITQCGALPPNKPLSLEDDDRVWTPTAQQACEYYGEGFLGTTCC